LYTGLRLDYRLRLWAPTSVSHAISAVAELLVVDCHRNPLPITITLTNLEDHFRCCKSLNLVSRKM